MLRVQQGLLIVVLGWLASGAVLAKDLPDFGALVERNRASIVNISTTQRVHTSASEQQGFPEGSPFEYFFRHFGPGMPAPQPRGGQSLGSGFVVSSDGRIMTNAHVVADADTIMVRFADKTELPAQVLGVDERTDVALLQVERNDLRPVEFGDSGDVRVGEWVLAVGSPFGLEYTATQGIVSAVGRNLPSDSYVPFIQTDAAVNPGNSGGPLFNTDGEVIGINSQIYSRTGGYMGLSFAIPIDLARKVTDQLAAQGYVTRGWLGVSIQTVTSDLARSFGLERPNGALISAVEDASPAARAGLRAGDIVLAYDGAPVDDSADLPPLVGETPIGEKVPIEIWRDRKAQRVNVEIAALDEPDTQRLASTAAPGGRARMNIQVAPLSPAQRQGLGLADGGAVVTAVGPGPAAQAGMRAGDVLLEIDGRKIDGPGQLGAIVDALPAGEPVAVLLQRERGRVFLSLTLPS